MKMILFICSFLLFGSAALAQAVYDCKLIVTNMTGNALTVGAQLTAQTPNNCPPVPSGSFDFYVGPGAAPVEYIFASPDPAAGDPMISPYIIGAGYLVGGGSATWITNACWHYNPSCIDGAGPLTIVVTSCGSNETHVTVWP